MPSDRSASPAARPDAPAPSLSRPPGPPDRVLELPMRLLGRTVRRTRLALATLQPGQVLAVHTDDP